MTETITSPQNEKLKLVRRLADRRGRHKAGMFVTEGEDLLAAGLEAGLAPEFVLVPVGRAALGAEALEVEADLLGEVSALGSGTRALAVWPIEDPVGEEPSGEPCLYLSGVGDPGNVGTIIRTATALTGARVVLGAGCADPYGPKAVRASMGAIFSSPPRRGTVEQTPEPRLALVAHGGESLERALEASVPRTVCLGAEREGLGPEALAACGASATIPVRAGAESLNVAATAAIALYRISSAVQPGPPVGPEGMENNG